jgi:hypothetical protein
MNPLSPRAGRARMALLVGLLACLLGSSLAWAQPAAKQPPAAPQPTQAGAALYLPMLRAPSAPTPVGAPTIERFTISSAAGPMAAEVELRWLVRDATSLSIEPRLGDVRGGASMFDYPLATTTYTLTASNARGSVSANVRYTVNALPTPNPLTVVATTDDARAVAAAIGPAGGTLEASGADGTRYTLSVPPEALLYSEVITLTPVAAISGMPFTASAVHAVSIAPEGLEFIDPATLAITPPAAAEGMRTLGIAFEGAGSEFHLRPLLEQPGAALAQAGAASQLSVTAASSQGTAAVSPDDELLAPPNWMPTKPQDAADHITITVDENPPPGPASIYEGWVLPLLTLAADDPKWLDSAAQLYINWRRQIRQREDEFRAEITKANLLLGEALRKAGALASERCNEGRPEQGFALQRYMAYAKRFGLANTRAALEERLNKCWRFQLIFHSQIDERLDPVVAIYELKTTLDLTYSDGRLVGSGPLNWERFILDNDDPDCQIVTDPEGSTFDAAREGLGLWVAPVSRTSPNVSLRLSYDHGRPMGDYTVFCPDTDPVEASSPSWWAYYGEMHKDERQQGEIFTANAPAVSFSNSPGWVYDNTLPANNITEHTEIRLEHKPIS